MCSGFKWSSRVDLHVFLLVVVLHDDIRGPNRPVFLLLNVGVPSIVYAIILVQPTL